MASALLANGVHLVAEALNIITTRTPGYRRGGSKCLMQVGDGNSTTKRSGVSSRNIRRTSRLAKSMAEPSFRFGAVNDLLGGLIPAGFYYKTFMWPRKCG